ncbi:unnamed protein product [Phytomonas sp. Hart1]|nr:unnamed protein product [Phytomonas sp. Hart1]|eukprot:CCW66158.1 unnamed protein product [Phytomonas sp. isolate Hart1]
MECEVGVVCLSALVPPPREAHAGSSWEALLEAADGIFHQRLGYWLWRALSRVRSAAIIIGSKELFRRVPILQEIERFVVHQRLVLAPRDPRWQYWLPAAVAGSVLALCCPAHHKCRRIAFIALRPPRAGARSALESETDCFVKLVGEPHCQSVCLHGFDRCPNGSHVCLLPCHLMGHPSASSPAGMAHPREISTPFPAQDEADPPDGPAIAMAPSPHGVCGYPCGKVLPCGHVCHRACGAPCEPCRFVGYRELACGQRVVSGIHSADMAIQYTFFAHFQKTRCGAPPSRCEVPVSLACPRCGLKSKWPCFRLTEAESPSGQCPGCVALFNKIAAKHGLAEWPAPARETDGELSFPGADASGPPRENAELPLHLLSPELRHELDRAFLLARKKSELLMKKDALEISSGKLLAPGSKPSDFVLYRDQYNAQKSAQAREEEQWKISVNEQNQHWAQCLREQVEKQVNMNARMENTWPLLQSEAEAEMRKQEEDV